MKKIVLQRLSLVNFKGISSLNLEFGDLTDIFGANGKGKTTIFDAFTWLLFGKDSQDRKDFDIKPLDKDGNVIQKIENEVEGVLLCNGEEITLKRIHREKWVKKRGSAESEFTGNETIYFWNDVPMNAKDYTTKINELLDESVFKLISNPLAFNNLKWQDRRKVLIDIAGEIKVDYSKYGLEHVLELTQKKTISELKAEVIAKVKKLKDELKQIPTRIDEVKKSIPDVSNFEQLEKDLALWENDLKEIDNQIQDASNSNQELINRKTQIQNKIFDLKSEINNIEHDLKLQSQNQTKVDTSKVDALKQQLSNHEFEITNAQNGLKQIESKRDQEADQIEKLDKEMAELRTKWSEVNSDTLKFDESDFHCPACKREFEIGDTEAKKEQLLANFNLSKKNNLDAISQKGGHLKAESEQLKGNIECYTKRIQDGTAFINKLVSELNSIKSAIEVEQSVLNSTDTKSADSVLTELLVSHPKYNSLKTEVTAHETSLQEIVPITNDELIQKKKETASNIDIIKSQLNVKYQVAAAENRIKELEQEENKYSTSLLELEKQEFDIEKFIKVSVEALENTVNQKFKTVKFKLFETQINGGEIECCDALVNGVPFHSTNNASKVNAGIDIINTLADFYQVNAPIFIDNRESVSELINSESQIINLIVSASDTTIRTIHSNQLEYA